MSAPLAGAVAYLRAGRPQQALNAAGRLLATDPQNAGAATVVMQSLLSLGRHAEARTVAERALVTRPDDAIVLRLHALICAALGDRAAAHASSRRAAAVGPGEWRTHLALAQVDLELHTVTPETWNHVHEAVRLAPDQPSAHFTAGILALDASPPLLDTAERAFTATLRLDPNHADARNNLAVVAHRHGHRLASAAGFADAVRSDPSNTLALGNLDRIVTRFVWLLQYGVTIALILVGRFGIPGSLTALRIACGTVTAAIVVVIALVAVRLRIQDAANLRRYFRTLPQRRVRVRTQLILLANTMIFLAIGAVVPSTAIFGYVLATLLASVGLVLVLLEQRWVRRHHA